MIKGEELISRAAKFAADHSNTKDERRESQTFYNEFFEIFGIRRRKVATFEHAVKLLDKQSTGFVDLFWPKTLLIEQKTAGRDLEKAGIQAFGYLNSIPDGDHPRYVLVSDFQNFELYDLDAPLLKAHCFKLAELPENIERFSFILGRTPKIREPQDPVNGQAAELMAELYESLLEKNYPRSEIDRYMVRLLFVLFADDTGIFQPKDILLDAIENKARDDKADIGRWLNQLFETLGRPEDKRSPDLSSDLADYPYVNGGIFEGYLSTADFSGPTLNALLEACRFNWQAVSPAIFGALFESILDPNEQRQKGAHYTSETNILKVIEPLFLDRFRERLKTMSAKRSVPKAELVRFLKDLSSLAIFDPACGCGNFLVVAYKELRALEIEALQLLYPDQFEMTALDADRLSVRQFHGIELNEFAVEIARAAMWMTDHIMNNDLSAKFGVPYARIPLTESPHIKKADALEIDWSAFVPPTAQTYVIGNPPFIGSKYQTPGQRQQIAKLLGKAKPTEMDYVAGWFIKGADYISDGLQVLKGSNVIVAPRLALVATNSIVQGQQVGMLWRPLFKKKMEILFAHRTFRWTTKMPGVELQRRKSGDRRKQEANVSCVVIGLAHGQTQRTRPVLFDYVTATGSPVERVARRISPYLFDAEVEYAKTIVDQRTTPINGAAPGGIGSKPVDGKNLIFSGTDASKIFAKHPTARGWLRPYYGTTELLSGSPRFILALQNVPSERYKNIPEVTARLKAVSAWRSDPKRSADTQKMAATPTRYHVTNIPQERVLAIPKVSSESRLYVPIAWLEHPAIPSDMLNIIKGATDLDFAFATSSMMMAWLDHIGGKHENRYRFTFEVVYNTFPRAATNASVEKKVGPIVEAVVTARTEATATGHSLEDMYDPLNMPTGLLDAHRALDRFIERLYRKPQFQSDAERMKELFRLYTSIV